MNIDILKELCDELTEILKVVLDPKSTNDFVEPVMEYLNQRYAAGDIALFMLNAETTADTYTIEVVFHAEGDPSLMFEIAR